MIRALVIDKDAVARTDLKEILLNFADCEEAADHESAVTLFGEAIAAGSPYHLVVLETAWHNGSQQSLLNELRAIESQQTPPSGQQVCILAMTAAIGRQVATDLLMQGFDDVINKPFDADLIRGKLNQLELTADKNPDSEAGVCDNALVSTSRILDTISRRLKKGDLELPPAPRIALKLMQLLTCNADTEEVVTLLKQDPTIAAKLIGVSNSAYYRGRTENATLAQAVHWLGLTRTHEIVTSICCRGYFVTNHPAYKQLVEKLWWHSLACAHATEMVIRKSGWSTEEDLFTLGLLHDIGKLVIIQVTGDLRRPKKSKQNINFNDLFMMMTAHHERFGANILKKLGYPEEFVALVRHHHRNGESASTSRAMQAIQSANLLAKISGFHLGAADASESSAMLEAQGYTESMQAEMKEQIIARMEQLSYVFG